MISMVMWEHTIVLITGTKHLSEGRDTNIYFVDNKNRVLSLRTTLGSSGSIRKIGGSNPPLGTIQTKYDSIWIILTNKI